MSSVDRYNVEAVNDGGDLFTESHKSGAGAWVRYEDHAAALAAEREKWEAVANYGELTRCPKAIRLMLAGVVDQCCKGQWFNVTHRLHEVQSEVATRLQRAVNGDPAHMSPNRIGVWGFRDDRGSAATSALDAAKEQK